MIKLSNLYESIRKQVYYHSTLASNLSSIKRKGLVPSWSKDESFVYFNNVEISEYSGGWRELREAVVEIYTNLLDTEG